MMEAAWQRSLRKPSLRTDAHKKAECPLLAETGHLSSGRSAFAFNRETACLRAR